ncbi:unnamed protein product, partial [Amoebophrya sp. A25]
GGARIPLSAISFFTEDTFETLAGSRLVPECDCRARVIFETFAKHDPPAAKALQEFEAKLEQELEGSADIPEKHRKVGKENKRKIAQWWLRRCTRVLIKCERTRSQKREDQMTDANRDLQEIVYHMDAESFRLIATEKEAWGEAFNEYDDIVSTYPPDDRDWSEFLDESSFHGVKFGVDLLSSAICTLGLLRLRDEDLLRVLEKQIYYHHHIADHYNCSDAPRGFFAAVPD